MRGYIKKIKTLKKYCKVVTWQKFKFLQSQHFLKSKYMLKVVSSSQKLYCAHHIKVMSGVRQLGMQECEAEL